MWISFVFLFVCLFEAVCLLDSLDSDKAVLTQTSEFIRTGTRESAHSERCQETTDF